MQSRRDKQKGRTRTESTTIVKERNIWPLIGAVQQKERNVQSVGGMVILCCQGKSDNYATGGKAGQRRRVSDRRRSHNANFVGDQKASDSEENCAFAFAVTENQGETCNATRQS